MLSDLVPKTHVLFPLLESVAEGGDFEAFVSWLGHWLAIVHIFCHRPMATPTNA